MGWEAIVPRAGVRSAGSGVTCGWRGAAKRLAITLGAEVCRTLRLDDGKKESVEALIDRAQGRLRLVIGRPGGWMPRPKDGCCTIHLPLDHLVPAPPSKPAQSCAFEVDPVARAVTITLPAWAAPGAAAARDAAAAAMRRTAA